MCNLATSWTPNLTTSGTTDLRALYTTTAASAEEGAVRNRVHLPEHEYVGHILTTRGELFNILFVFYAPLLRRIRDLDSTDRIGRNEASSYAESDHRQGEGEHNLTGAHVREQECLIGDRTIKLPTSKSRRQRHVIAVIVHLPVRSRDGYDRLIRTLPIRSGVREDT